MANEERDRSMAEIRAAADAVGEITDDVRRKWFRDYGCCNGWTSETRRRFNIADALHERDKAAHPELHKPMPQRQHWNCWHEYNCSCGLCSSCDTSD